MVLVLWGKEIGGGVCVCVFWENLGEGGGGGSK